MQHDTILSQLETEKTLMADQSAKQLQNQSLFTDISAKQIMDCSMFEPDSDMDLLLANAGYHVRTSDLPHVAQRLEHLDSVVSSAPQDVTSLLSDSVYHNPSDMASWIECMIDELAPICGDQGSVPKRLYSLSDVGFNMDPLLDAASNFNNNLHSPTDSFSSISELIKESIDEEDASPFQNGKDQYPGSGLILDEISNLQRHYKGVDDQASSSSNFYTRLQDQNNNLENVSVFSDVFNQSSATKVDFSPQQQQIHQTQKYGAGASPQLVSQSPASASPRSSSYGSPAYNQNHQNMLRHSKAKQQDVNVNAVANQSPTVSSSSPMVGHGANSPYGRNNGTTTNNSPYGINNGINAYSQYASNNCANGINSPYSAKNGKCHHGVAYADYSEDGAQEAGIRLVHLLMSCAEAVQNHELTAALDMAREIKLLASYHNGSMGKVANHFVEALVRRICDGGSSSAGGSSNMIEDVVQTDAISELLYIHFYESCPYLKFAHFTANQAILEAFEGHNFVHVIDFNLMQGLQWPALIQALALRPGGPPHLRITGVGLPQPDNRDVLQEIGLNLARLAESVNVEFSFRGVIATKLNDIKPRMLEIKEGEAIAVNSILQLHRLLNGQTSTASVRAPIDEVLDSIKTIKPKIVTIVEQEASHNSPVFLDRFVQALHYYCTMFDSLEACCLPLHCAPEVMYSKMYAEMYLGREIVNIVACEGVSRIERHEPLVQWQQRMMNAGFRRSHLGSNAFNQASMLLSMFSGEGYTVEENSGCLTLGWHSRPLIAASAWHCG